MIHGYTKLWKFIDICIPKVGSNYNLTRYGREEEFVVVYM